MKEKGKNSIGLNGGVSGLAGSFIGLSYQTNNFLGLGETLGVNLSYGQYQRNLSFSFMQPYLFDRPLQAGFTVFNTKYNYNQAQQLSIQTNQQLNLPDSIQQTLQNFSQTSTGFNVSLSYPIKRSFKRIGLTYTLNTTTLQVFSNFSRLYFEELNFSNVAGTECAEWNRDQRGHAEFQLQQHQQRHASEWRSQHYARQPDFRFGWHRCRGSSFVGIQAVLPDEGPSP